MDPFSITAVLSSLAATATWKGCAFAGAKVTAVVRKSKGINHDLQRAALRAKCQATITCISSSIMEDFKQGLTFASKVHLLATGGKAEVADLRFLQEQYQTILRQLEEKQLTTDQIDQYLQGPDLDLNAIVPKEAGAAAMLFREQLTEALQYEFSTIPRPQKFIERLDRDWFDLFRLLFREEIKNNPRVKTAYDLDRNEQFARNFSGIDEQLVELAASVTAIHKKLESFDPSEGLSALEQRLSGIEAGYQSAINGLSQQISKLDETVRSGFEKVLATLNQNPVEATQPTQGTASAYHLKPKPFCVGREPEIQTLRGLLLGDDAGLSSVNGLAGAGKSTVLAATINQVEIEQRFAGRRAWVDCRGAPSEEALRSEICQAIRLPPDADWETIRNELGGARACLVLDNFETPWRGPGSAGVDQRLKELSQITTLHTVVGIRGQHAAANPERQLAVQPFPQESLEYPRQIFLQHANNLAPDPTQLDAFLAGLDGLPLAIYLAASKASALGDFASFQALWEQKKTEVLRIGRGDREQSLAIALQVSMDQILDQGRQLAGLLGLLPGGISRDDLLQLLPETWSDAIEQLAETGLIQAKPGRLTTLEPIREYFAEQVSLDDALQQQMIAHYLSLAASGGKLGRAEGEQVKPRLIPEVANIEALFTRLFTAPPTHPSTADCVSAARGWSEFVRFSGYGTTTPILQACEVGTLKQQANCIQSLGDIHLARSQHDEARDAYNKAIPLYKQVGSILGEANCILSLGQIHLQRSQHDEARDAYNKAIPLFQQVGDIIGQANCIQSLGEIHLQRSQHDKARDAFQQAIPLFQQVGSILGEANCIIGLGIIHLARSQHDKARDAFQQAIPLFQQVGDIQGEATCIQNLGAIHLQRSQHELAKDAFQQAIPLFQQVGFIQGEAQCIQNIGAIHLQRSQHELAKDAFQQAIPLFQQVGFIQGEAQCIQNIGQIALQNQQSDLARERWQEAIGLYEQIPDPHSLGVSHYLMISIEEGTQRKDHFERARGYWQQIGRTDLVEFLVNEYPDLA